MREQMEHVLIIEAVSKSTKVEGFFHINITPRQVLELDA